MIKPLIILLAGTLLFVGCGKDHRAAKGIDSPEVLDWGRIELPLNTPKRLSLGEGKECSLTVVSADHGQLQIKIETRHELVGSELPPVVSPGAPVESIRTMTTTIPSGIEVAVSVDQKPVRFTLILKDSSA